MRIPSSHPQPFRRGHRFRLLAATRFPSRLSSRRFIRRPLAVVPCRLVPRFVLLAACRLIPRSVPRLVYRSARRRLIRHLIPGVISSAALPQRAPFRLLAATHLVPFLVSFRRSVVSTVGSFALPVSTTREAGRFLIR